MHKSNTKASKESLFAKNRAQSGEKGVDERESGVGGPKRGGKAGSWMRISS